MKHYKLFKEGDKVVITHTHIDDLGKEGVITLVRASYCKIMIDGKNVMNYLFNIIVIIIYSKYLLKYSNF